MKTRCGSLVGLVLLVTHFLLLIASSSAAPPVKVRWYGQAFFTLTTASNLVVAIDPFDGTFLNYPIPQELKADILLVTHEHKDHNNVPAIKGDPLLLRAERAITKEEKNGVKLRGISAYHDDQNGGQRGRDTIFTIETDGLRFCHLGDLGQSALSEEQVARVGAVDVLFLPAGGHFTTEPKGLRKIVDQLKPRVVVPMHYKTPYTRDLPLVPVDEFLKLNSDLKVKRLDSTEFTVGNEPLPEKMEIWLPAIP